MYIKHSIFPDIYESTAAEEHIMKVFTNNYTRVPITFSSNVERDGKVCKDSDDSKPPTKYRCVEKMNFISDLQYHIEISRQEAAWPYAE